MSLTEADGANLDPDLVLGLDLVLVLERGFVLEWGFDFCASFLALARAHGWSRLQGIVAGCGLRMLLRVVVTFDVG